MKNKKLATGVSGTLLALLLLAGCETEQKHDQKLTRKFAEWMLNKANTEALESFDKNYEYNAADEVCLRKARNDSISHREALERDADVVLKYTKTCATASDVWEKIQKAPLSYDYGPGSFINKDGEWEYGDHVNTGACKEYKCKVNYDEYKSALKEIYRIRNAKSKNK